MPKAGFSVTIFLLRKDQVAACKNELLAAATQLPIAAPLDGVVVAFGNAAQPPAWVPELANLLTTPQSLDLTAQSPSALALVNRAGRSFVLTFGHAWQKLRSEWLEPDFGRHVVLNLITRDQLVEIRAEQVLARWHLASERAPRPASVDDFGVEFDRDLVEGARDGAESVDTTAAEIAGFARESVDTSGVIAAFAAPSLGRPRPRTASPAARR